MRTTKERTMAALTVACVLLTATAFAVAPVQTFYVPFPEAQLLQGLQAIAATGDGSTPANPMSTYVSIAAAAGGTIVYYDQWENGYDADISNPANLYSVSNPGGTQIWGDGNAANGAPPGIPGDVISAGTVIILNNQLSSATPLNIDFDGRDKIAATKNVAVTRTGWASGSSTLLAGSVEVFATEKWGTDYRSPVGTDIPNGVDEQMFQYTALAIMAGPDGAVVQIDKDANGVFETTQTLAEGQSYYVNGSVEVGARVLSDKPVQVDILTGDIGSDYESRDSALLPISLWAHSYYTPVSTVSSYGTTVWLYNPATTELTVQYQTRNTLGALTTTPLTVPGGSAGGYLKQVILNNYGARFYTTGAPFYAFSTTDSTDTDSENNQAYDWGYTLVPEEALTPQVLVGLGIGRDPLSSSTQNGNPVWVTPVGNGNTAVNVYVDYDANPATGALIDSNGNKYDVLLSLKELERAKVFDTVDRNQTGMLVYTLTAGVKLAAAWGQDPSSASAGAPGLDVGTGIPPLPVISTGKSGQLLADNDGNGFLGPGDSVLYTITVNNVGRAPVSDVVVADNLPSDVTYIPGTTVFKNAAGVTTPIPDDTVGTPFPLDGAGRNLDPANPLPVGGVYEVRLQVTVNPDPAVQELVNTGTTTAFGITLPFEARNSMLGRIGDFVWSDVNRNGLQDDGPSSALQNITVRLYTSGNVLVDTTTTADTGRYLFSGLLPGSYYVEFVLPDSTYDFSPRDQGGDDTLDSDADVTVGRTVTFTLAAGQADMTRDAGMYVIPTVVEIADFGGDLRDGRAVVRWTTTSEKGSIGYFLLRLNSLTGDYEPVNSELLPAVLFSSPEQVYEVIDAGAAVTGENTYKLVEVENTGVRNEYGPYIVTFGSETADSVTVPVAGGEGAGVSMSAAPAVQSALEIRQMTAGRGHLVLRWNSAAGATYAVERSTAPTGPFDVLASGIPATAPENVLAIVDGANAAFYRVRVE